MKDNDANYDSFMWSFKNQKNKNSVTKIFKLYVV